MRRLLSRSRLWRVHVRSGETREALLRAWSPQRMRIVAHSWPLKPTVCPCDVDFSDFLRDRDIRGQSVFHLGSGGHHLLGWRNVQDRLGNTILAITISPSEVRRYLRMAVKAPLFAKNYRVLFADVHDLQPAALPDFDVVSLFHLAEFGPASANVALSSATAVFDVYLSRLRPGGLLLLYNRSFGYREVSSIAQDAVARGELEKSESFRSLEVFRVVRRST